MTQNSYQLGNRKSLLLESFCSSSYYEIVREKNKMPLTEKNVKSICSSLLNADMDEIEFPGGSSRESVRATIGGKGLIVTHRKNLQRAQLESGVLKILNQHNAPVPHLIASKNNYLIQQDVGRHRLSERLRSANEQEVPRLLGASLESLCTIHEIGKQSDALQSIVVLGQKLRWLQTFVGSAERLGAQLKISAPTLQFDKLVKMLEIEHPTLIKWDARPGNAIVHESGKVIWIDWEHCGKRHPLDDVAWLLTDEYTPDIEAVENQLISKIIPSFANGFSEQRALEYLAVYGTLHSCIRLGLILRYHAEKGWWDYDYCLKFDKVGVVQELAQRVARRAARWAQRSELTKDLSPWFDDVLHKLSKI